MGLARNNFYHITASLRGSPRKSGEENSLSVQNCEHHNLLFTLCGGQNGLRYEYTLAPIPEGTTIKDQRERKSEKEANRTMEVSIICNYLCLTLEYVSTQIFISY